MEKFCVKGYLKRSGKRVLSILLCACMIGTMIPITARAETEGTSMPSNGEVTCTCANLCTEDKVNSDCPVCGAEEADLSKCTGKVQSENNENQLNTGESEEAKNETDLTITAWEWIDEEELINPETGILALPFANEETPAFFDDVVALLPTQIQATVVNAEDIEAKAASEPITLGDWSCEEYPKEGAYSESYTFAAALPEGYILSDEAKALNVLVELGGAQMLNLTGVSYLSCDENGTNWTKKTCNDAIEVTSGDNAWGTSEYETWYVVQGDVEINRDLEVLGNVHLILTDKSSLDVQGSILVRKSQNSSLTIYGQSTPEVDEEGHLTSNTGKLKVSGKTNNFSGIGGGGVTGERSNAGSITINGGVIYATGGSYGAGIGGGDLGNGGTITINGGMVTATGGPQGAGIGGGAGGAGGNIIINGGSINAKGGFWAAGIGGGTSGKGGTIKINGGDIKATGGEKSAGIGGSHGDTGTSAGDIFISGGTITATGGLRGAGIGNGYQNTEGGKIIISGGTVTAIGGDKSKGIGFSNNSPDNTITISGGTVTATGSGGGAGIGGGNNGSGSGITMNGDVVLYTSSINGEHTFSKGVIYDGVTISDNAGSYTLTGGVGTVYGNPNVSGFTEPRNSILGTNLADTDCITVTVPDVDYTGAEAVLTATVTVNKIALSKTLVQDIDYTVSVSGSDKTNAGAKTATITAVTNSGNVGETTGSFNIKPVELSAEKIEMTLSGIPEAGYVYDNAAKEPVPVVTLKRADGSKYTLIKDTDYTVLYSNNTNAYELLSGNEGYEADKAPTVKITAKEGGNFTGSRSMNFKIYPADMPGFTITPYSGSYDGINHDVVSITPKDGFSDYTVYYSTDNKATWSTTVPTITDAGMLDFYVKATKANYKDWISEKQTAKVTPVALASSMMSFNDTNHYYTGREVKPEITVKDSNRTLVPGTDYTVSYTNNTSVSAEDSKAKVTITAANGNYTGSASAEFSIAYAQETYLNYCTVSGIEGKDGWYSSDVTIQNKADINSLWGELQFSGSPTGAFADSYIVSTEGKNNTTIWFKQTTTEYIGSQDKEIKIDKTAPTWPENGGISVKENWWKKLVNTISFGLFYKDATVEVKVCAKDNLSGIDAYYYYVDTTGSTTVLSSDVLDTKTFTKVDGSGAQTLISLDSENKYVVYAYAIDNAGNRSDYVCSDGVVLDRTAPTISGITVPSKSDLTLTDTSAKISFTGSEAGICFYMISEVAPDSIDSFATSSENSQGMTVWTAKEGVSSVEMATEAKQITLSSLSPNTTYTLYLAAVDKAGNSTATVHRQRFTTCKTMPVVTKQPTISGTYGQTVADMTLTDGVAKVGSEEITGTWAVTDSNKANVPAVGIKDTYQVTFTPADTYGDIYDTVIVLVNPTVSKRVITVTADDKTKTYGQANPAFTFAITEGTLVGTDTKEDLGITLTCVANENSPVKAGGYAITGTSNSANYQVTVIPGVLTITKATPVITATTGYTKTYGDIKFFLDATDNSAEASLQYAVTESKDTSDSAVENDAIVSVDARGYVTIKGAGSAKITASLSETTNYNAASREITITVDKAAAAPNMPAETMDVPYHCEKVSDVPLPEDWVWQEADKSTELSIDRIVTADAVYDGADKGNYVKETVSVSLTRKDISGGLCIEEISDRTYNGKQIRPEVWVYYEKQLLTAGKDYTVSYKNNTNAAAADAVNAKGASIAPTVTVKGKGNYTGTVTKTFTIKPINLDNYKTDAQLQEILTIEPVCAKHTGKFIKATPTVKLNGKKLALSAKQYTCEYNDGNTRDQEAYKDCGTYNITIVGSEKNFVGETTVTETISGELISKATITLDRSSYPYDKETGETFPAKVTVKYGKNTLTEGIDYTVSYKDYDKIGTAAVIITGMGNYSGVKTKTYKITGTKLTSRMITQINKSFSYDGTEHSVENGTDYKIEDGTAGLVEGKNYTVAYKGDRTKAGSFKVTFSGIGAYSGTVTKTFTIQKASVSTLTVTLPDESVAYTKGGVKPKPEVRFGGVLLIEGTDYTVTYQNNTKAASAEDKKAPCLYITGKGSFTGNTKASPVKFTIMQAPLSAQTIVVDNVPYKNRNGNYVPAITITDSTTGKKLAKNTDYSGSFTYEIWDAAAGDYVSFTGKKVETSEDNIRMRVTISAKGSYSGEASVEYEICPKSIASVKVEKIPNQEYTGQAIAPKLTITDNGADLTEGIHYTVEYTNNIKKGTATVTIRGKGQYGGSKTVKFKITSRIFKWS